MRDFATAFYSSTTWKKTRAAYLHSVVGLCERCLAKGLYKPAEVVHHKTHITPENINNPEITLAFDNLEALCRKCHGEAHGGPRYDVDDMGRLKI